MDKIKELHLDVISHALMYNKEFDEIEGKEYASSKSANITRQIAIEFAEYCRNVARREGTYGEGFSNNWELCGEQKIVTTQDLFEEFLKTK